MLFPLPALRVLGLFAIACITPAFGSTAFYIIQKDTRFTQTSTAAPTTPDNFDFFATVSPDATFDGGTVTGPGAFGTQTLSNLGTELQYGSGIIATQNPTGTYTFNVTDSGTPANNTSVSVDDTTETFPDAIPALTGASYTGLQNLDPTQAFTVNFNTFTGPAALAFFAILDLNTNAVPIFDGLQPNAGQDTIAANSLVGGDSYEFILFFTTNVDTTNTQLQLTDRTRGFFTTQGAVPEPGTVLFTFAGMCAMVWLNRQRVSRRFRRE